MSRSPSPWTPKDKLNRMTPAASEVSLGVIVDDLITQGNALVVDGASLRTKLTAAIADLATLRTAFNTLTAKLNADGGVTDADYATLGALTATNPAAATAVTVTVLASR